MSSGNSRLANIDARCAGSAAPGFDARNVTRILFCVCLLFAWVLPASAQATPTPTPIPQSSLASLSAYRCTFDANTHALQINAAVGDENGMPFEPNAYRLSASVTGGSPFPADSVTFSSDAQRPPLRLVLVLDITDTVPIDNIVSALTQDLIPNLQPLDELAMITFSDEVSPPTRFYTDKNRLVSEYLVGLKTVGGDNRVYDATLTAAELFPFDASTRKVVVLVTDSGLRRNIAQATPDQIISRASADGTQIYSIGFYSEDRPDEQQLRAIAAGTHAFTWLYGESPNTPASIESAVRSDLQSFVRLLDSEIAVSIDAKDVPATADNLLPITLSADVAGLGTLTSAVTCPYQVITRTITFTGTLPSSPIRGKADIGVVVSPASDDTSVVFRVDGSVVQNSTATVFTLDAAQLPPGDHLIEAQLWNRNNETLAATNAPLSVFTQQTLTLSVAGGGTRDLSGAVEFQASANPTFALSGIQLMVARAAAPDASQPLGIMQPAGDGAAALDVDDIAAAVGVLFPELRAGESLQITAVAPNPAPGAPPFAMSDPLPITLASAAAPALATPASVTAAPQTAGVGLAFDNLFPLLPLLATIFFGVLNIILFRAVRKSRIHRLIAHPDNHDLSPQMMSLTLYRGGVPQSYSLTKKTVTLGRGSNNDINLGDDPNISRQHGVVMWRRSDWYYSNRKERLVTRINRRRYRGLVFHRLEPMTELQIGDVTLLFHSNAQQDLSDFIKTDL